MQSFSHDQRIGRQIWRRLATEAPVVAVTAAFLILYVDLPVALRLAQHTGSGAISLLDAISHLGRGEYYIAAQRSCSASAGGDCGGSETARWAG